MNFRLFQLNSKMNLITRSIATSASAHLVRKVGFQPILANTRSLSFIVVGDQSGFDKLDKSSGKKIFYFTATWCPPCRMIAPIFEKLAAQHKDVDFCKVDVDQMPEAAQKYRVSAVPTFAFMHGSKKVSEFAGADEKRLKTLVVELEAHK